MTIPYFKPELKKRIEEKVGWCKYTTNQRELIAMCPFEDCDFDSGKSNHGHLYIDTTNPVFFCQKCNTTGSIFKLLSKLKIKPEEVLNVDELKKNKFTNIYLDKDTVITQFDKLKIKKQNFESYNDKLLYLKSRIGVDVQLEKIPNLIFEISEFIKSNHIKIDENDQRLLPYYDQNFIGVLTNRGTSLILRNIYPNSDKRYHKINLTKNSLFKDFYGIKIGNTFKNINHVILCEGIFDLLVSFNSPQLKDLKNKSCYWACCLGSYYKSTLFSVLDEIKLSIVDVSILSDSDKKSNNPIYKDIYSSPVVNSLCLYYNTKGNDFGESQISLIKTKPKFKIWRKNYGSRAST